MRALVTIAATLALALAGCSGGATETEPMITTTEVMQSGPVELELGQTANLTGTDAEPRDIDVTVTEITVSDDCLYGPADSGGGAESAAAGGGDEGEGYVIEVAGLIDVRESPVDFAVSEWRAVDADRNTLEVVPADDCAQNPESGIQSFSDPVMPGAKAKVTSEYRVNALPERWNFKPDFEDSSFSWPVPEQAAESSTSSSTQVTTTAESEAVADCVVGSYGQPQFQGTTCLEEQISSCGDPSIHEMGTTFFAGGGSGWTQTCADQMMAQWTPPQYEPPTYEDDSCAAAICGYGYDEQGNPNPSSGEIQTQDGCQQGYITDPELCAAVGVPVG